MKTLDGSSPILWFAEKHFIVATGEKTTDVVQTLMFARPSDIAGARDTTGGYTTDEIPKAMPQTQRSASGLRTQFDTAPRKGDLGWAHTSDYVRVIVEHKETSEGTVSPEDVRPISVAPEVHRSSGAAEDEVDNGYQKDTMENNVTKASNANDALYVLEFENIAILANFVRCVQKTTSRISLNFEKVALLSKFVCLDSEICFESNSNEGIRCFGFCGTRKQIFFRIVSCDVVMRPLLRNSDFGCTFVLCCLPQDLKVPRRLLRLSGKIREPISPSNYTSSTPTSSHIP